MIFATSGENETRNVALKCFEELAWLVEVVRDLKLPRFCKAKCEGREPGGKK